MNLPLPSLMKARVAADATAPQIADALFTMTLAIDAALVPTIEPMALNQLFAHTLAASAKTYPWMSNDSQDYDHGLDLQEMKLLFSQQTSDDAAGGATLFLKTFYDSLSGIIGVALSDRLLRPILVN